jgi:protein involved in polysaccharide export with SLBB domain
MKRILVLLIILCGVVAAYSAAKAANELPLQPGDIISISLPGEPAFAEPFQIGRDGALTLPEVGEVYLSGLSIGAAREAVRSAISKVYKDLSRLEVSVKQHRLVVSVLGYVKNPGPVDLAANSTVQMAITAAGGLAQGAQLDRLQLRRNGVAQKFDYKKYLDVGDPALIPELQSLDVIFVPASPLTGNVQIEFDAKTLSASGDAAEDGAAIYVFGEVHRPGTFGYKEGSSIIDMIMRAGGVTRYAGIEQIRIIADNKPFPFNMREYMDTGSDGLMPDLNPGDTIFVPQASDQVKVGARVVYVMGEVFKPGAYETKEGASFLDILANSGGPTRFAETRQIRILKQDGTVEPFDLSAFTEGTNESSLPMITAGDAVFVPEKTDMNEKSWLKVSPNRAIRIIGAINRPGRYEWSDEMNILDLLAHAGGPAASADTAHVQVLLPDGTGEIVTKSFDLKRFLDNGGHSRDLPVISAGATIVVPELPKDPNDNRSQWVRQASDRSIYIFGQVKAPGRYAFNSELNFLDLLSAAQGPTARADLSNVRVTHRGEENARVSEVNLNLYFETGDDALIPDIMPEDVIYIPERDRDWLEQPRERTVRVLGAVGRPGRYGFDDRMTILDLLAEAGGPSPNALQDRIVVVNRAQEGPQARVFDLVNFAKTGDFSMLPLVQPGDTVFVPNTDSSNFNLAMGYVRDAVSILSLVRLAVGAP